MDERLEAGRHHLGNGERALLEGYLDDSRSHFEAALLQFRGPDLRIGEAHALRGLAAVELGCGNLALAEESARASVTLYQDIRALLQRIDPDGLSRELWTDAEEGEGAALVLLGDLLLRTGKGLEARETLSYAREVYEGLGDIPSSAGMWLALGRLALREGRQESAEDALGRAMEIHLRAGDLAGQCTVAFAQAELYRVQGDFARAERTLEQAVALTRQARSPALEGRALSHMGSLLVQMRRFADARRSYEAALPLLRASGDAQMEAYALIGMGDASSRLGERAPATALLSDGARIMGQLDNQHGLGAAMLRVSHHALRCGSPTLALAAAEAARQLWYHHDPIRGVGQALRLEVKALAALHQWPAVLTVASLRAAVAGEVQPNAVEVRDHYRARAPAAWLEELDALDLDDLETRADTLVAEVLAQPLAPLGLDPIALGSMAAGLALVEALAASRADGQVPEARPHARQMAEEPPESGPEVDYHHDLDVEPPPRGAEAPPAVDPVDAPPPPWIRSEPEPPLDDDPTVRLPPPPEGPPPIPEEERDEEPEEEPERTAARVAPREDVERTVSSRPPPAGYEDLYTPPGEGGEAEQDPGGDDEGPDVDDDEDDDALVRLRGGPPPAGYEDLYASPQDDEDPPG